ncbi:MAG: ABC transporter ATP-binding protein [Clostridia bacterium]|nr:ABC transporter ATP-binding protein [Clostridia bacterium]
MNKLLQITDLSCAYRPDRPILKGVSLLIERGEIVGLLGLNGSGKTTLFRCILGTLPYKGSVLFEGNPLGKNASKAIGYIPQGTSVPSLSVLDFVLLAFYDELPLFASPTKEQKERAKAMLEEVGIAYAEEDCASLSGGERQLALLARTFLRPCPLLVLDEPDASLDARNKKRVLGLLKRKIKEENRAALLSLHDLTFALNYCDRLLLLKDGMIYADFSPKDTPLEEMERILSVYGKMKIGMLHGEKDLFAVAAEDV